MPKEKSEIEQLHIQFSEEKEEKKREKNGKKKQQIEQPLWRMWAKQFQTGIYVLQYSTVGKKNAKMPGVMAEEIVVLKDGEVLTRTKECLESVRRNFQKQKNFSSCFQMIFSIEKKVVIYYNPKINRNI